MDGSAAPGVLATQNLSTLISTIQNAVQAQNLIATNIVKLTAAFNTAFPPPILGSVAWNPGGISSGSQASTTVTVTGAALGNFVKAAFSSTVSPLTLSAYVSDANTVTVVLSNNSGGTITPASGTVDVSVTKT